MKFPQAFALLIVTFALLPRGLAAPVDSVKAAATVSNWLQMEASPLGAKLGRNPARVETFKDSFGSALYHVVYLEPSGFVIVSADDQVEPIIAFAARGRFDPSEKYPLGALVSRDLPKRVAYARQHAHTPDGLKNLAKWQSLQFSAIGSTNSPASGLTNGSISDIRVAPLLATDWNQSTAPNGAACYNFFTPPYMAGNPNNAVCGCVATAMAQLMYFYQYPNAGVGTAMFDVSYADTSSEPSNTLYLALRGGDGYGGPYDWNDMPTNANSPSLIQCEAVGALTYDAGVAVHMQYTLADSGAFMNDAQTALLNTFQYANVILTGAASINIGYDLTDMVNPDLDAHLPVIFAIDNSSGGHCIVCDGYGYNFNTLYHHLNLGWGGDDNAWYELPLISLADTAPYYNLDTCLFNIFTNGSGEVISGRVLDQNGNPVANASVTATGGKTFFQTTTDTNGIYALPGVLSSTSYSLSVASGGHVTGTSNVLTGLSQNNLATCGNRWGINFVLPPLPLPPVFIVQPASGLVTLGSNASFYASAAAQWPVTYQWQYQPSGSLNWVNVADNGTYAGATNSALTIGPTTVSMNGEPFQCVASDAYGSVTSTPAILFVNSSSFISIATLAGLPGVSGATNGLNTNALFNEPHGLAVDSHTNIFVADMHNHVIRLVVPSSSGWSSSTIGGSAGIYGSANGIGTSAQFNAPYGVAVDGNGNVFVADTGNNLIRQLTLSGTNWSVSTIAGTAGVRGATDGTNALFNLPMGIAVDGSDNLYVADEGNHNIRELTLTGAGWTASTIAGSGTYGSNDGTNTFAQFGQPYGIAVNGSGTVFVADEYNDTIRQLLPLGGGNWAVTTIAGKSGVAGSTDGHGSAALFKLPTGIATDSFGDVYVADHGNDTIRRLSFAGTSWAVFTVAGIAGNSGSVDGLGTAVRLNLPFGVAVNNGTNIYVSDANNDTIRGPSLSSVTFPAVVHLTQLASPNNFAVSWSAVAGQTYQVQYKSSLSQTVWSNLMTITASNWTGVASVPLASEPQRFYRVIPAQ
jgi:hypothetical protein